MSTKCIVLFIVYFMILHTAHFSNSTTDCSAHYHRVSISPPSFASYPDCPSFLVSAETVRDILLPAEITVHDIWLPVETVRVRQEAESLGLTQ